MGHRIGKRASLSRAEFRRCLATLASVALAVGACGGSSPSAPATDSAVGAGATRVTANPTVASPKVAPSVSPLPSLALRWKSTGPESATPSFQPLAVDPTTGDVWASVPFANLFWIFSADGTFLESWGTSGAGPGQFDLNDHLQNPDGFGAIAFAPDGSFYVGDVGNHRIEKFDVARRFVKAWGTFGSDAGQFAQITAVATDGKVVYVGDGRGQIQAFDSTGAYLRTFGADGGFSAFVAIDLSGNAYATNPSVGAPAVAKFDPQGGEIARFDMSSIGDAVGVAVDPRGRIFVGAASTKPPFGPLGTYELSPDGRLLHGWSNGGGGYLALSTKGDTLYISGWTWPYIEAYAIPEG